MTYAVVYPQGRSIGRDWAKDRRNAVSNFLQHTRFGRAVVLYRGHELICMSLECRPYVQMFLKQQRRTDTNVR